MHPVRAAVAVVGLLVTLGGNPNLVEKRFAARSERLEVFLLQLLGERLQCEAASFQDDFNPVGNVTSVDL